MMEFLVNYWWLLLVGIAVIVVAGYAVYVFFKFPRSTQIAKVKEWLLFAVAEAEKELGSGTGQLKLRYVYDMFLAKFPFLVKVISFEAFSVLVDEALNKFRGMLETNAAVKTYIEGVPEKEEV